MSSPPSPPYTGRIVVRLAPPIVAAIQQWVRANRASLPTLADVARELHADHLQGMVSRYRSLPSQRAVTNVSAEIMLDLEDTARESPYPPIHSMVGYYIIDTREQLEGEQIDRLLTDLRNNPDVGLAYLEMGVQDAAVTPEDEPVYPANYKGHFDGRHRGINARNQKVWGVCDGAGIGLVDLEAGWNLDHQDLPRPLPPVFNQNRAPGNHGAAVLGVIVGRDNAKGIVGLAPGARVLKVVSHIKSTGSQYVPMDEWDVAGAIYDAIGIMNPGDVLLIEVQCVGPDLTGYPVETQEAWFTAIRNASGNGMIVVEAAGNGDSQGVGRNLDDWHDPVTGRKLSRAPANDSGALLVSACCSAVQPPQAHVRMSWANYGSRVDCYAWGENVYTAGGDGSLTQPEPDRDLWYTDSFSGTSSASAIIAGAAILLQCLAVRKAGQRLTPTQIRTLLSGTGTSIVNTTGQKIGIMPDLVKILPKLP